MTQTYKDLPLTLSVDEVAEVLGISRRLAYKLAKKKGGFPAARVGGKKRLVIPRDHLLSGCTIKPSSPLTNIRR